MTLRPGRREVASGLRATFLVVALATAGIAANLALLAVAADRDESGGSLPLQPAAVDEVMPLSVARAAAEGRRAPASRPVQGSGVDAPASARSAPAAAAVRSAVEVASPAQPQAGRASAAAADAGLVVHEEDAGVLAERQLAEDQDRSAKEARTETEHAERDQGKALERASREQLKDQEREERERRKAQERAERERQEAERKAAKLQAKAPPLPGAADDD